jgi:hypothetical protein
MTPIEIVIIAGKQASYDANEIVRLIDVLRAGNDKEIFPEINRRKASPTAITVQNALFTRLHTVVCRHYGPVRDGDYSAATAFKLLDDANNVEQASEDGGNKEQIKNWRLMWEVFSRDPKLKAYVHIRNKDVAHLAFKDPNIQPPIIREMFDVAQTTAMLLDKLAQALGCTTTDMEFERKEQRKSAEAFWGIWRV